MRVDVVELAQRLVGIPSVNPMGRDVSGPEFLETRLTNELEAWFHDRKIETERHTVLPHRDNLIAKIPGHGAAAKQVVMLEVHQDTVPVDGMTIDPFAAEVRDGRIYGRGACDVKGGMAAILAAAAQLWDSPKPSQPTIVCAFTINEENGFDGINHLVRTWQDGSSPLLDRAPDVAVIAEPSDLDVIVAHKGSVRWRCHAVGRAAHSSDPSQGSNAIYAMGQALTAIADYAEQHVGKLSEHPLVGRPTLSVGTINGGLSVNTVPDRCTVAIDRRLAPGECADAAQQHVVDHLAKRCPDLELVHDVPFLVSPGLESRLNGELAERLAKTSRAHGGSGVLKGVPFGTDAGAVSNSGVPAVVFGPGSIRQAHTRDEWIDVAPLEQAVDILLDFCWSFAE